ncbi:MAG: hypothetical protein II012_08685, partial [Ruminococcus sp.]|nr:hypothetical protein [Ruminococcus sp.]
MGSRNHRRIVACDFAGVAVGKTFEVTVTVSAASDAAKTVTIENMIASLRPVFDGRFYHKHP